MSDISIHDGCDASFTTVFKNSEIYNVWKQLGSQNTTALIGDSSSESECESDSGFDSDNSVNDGVIEIRGIDTETVPAQEAFRALAGKILVAGENQIATLTPEILEYEKASDRIARLRKEVPQLMQLFEDSTPSDIVSATLATLVPHTHPIMPVNLMPSSVYPPALPRQPRHASSLEARVERMENLLGNPEAPLATLGAIRKSISILEKGGLEDLETRLKGLRVQLQQRELEASLHVKSVKLGVSSAASEEEGQIVSELFSLCKDVMVPSLIKDGELLHGGPDGWLSAEVTDIEANERRSYETSQVLLSLRRLEIQSASIITNLGTSVAALEDLRSSIEKSSQAVQRSTEMIETKLINIEQKYND